MLWFFSSEKKWSGLKGQRNDRYLCRDLKDVPTIMHTNFPATVIVLGVMGNKRDIMLPHFFPQRLRANAKVLLERVVRTWIESEWGKIVHLLRLHHLIRQNDQVTIVTPNKWPSSPNLNPLDYNVWESQKGSQSMPP